MLALFATPSAFAPGPARPAGLAPAAASVQMQGAKGGTFAPAGMGKEFVSQTRKPLSDYVGASHELACFPGGVMQAWDPLDLSKLTFVSGNNPDVAWLREAELKHGRMAMLAIVG